MIPCCRKKQSPLLNQVLDVKAEMDNDDDNGGCFLYLGEGESL